MTAKDTFLAPIADGGWRVASQLMSCSFLLH